MRYYGFYSKKTYRTMLMKDTAKKLIIDPEVFTKRYKPSFIETFGAVKGETWEKYVEQKSKFQSNMLDEAIYEVERMEDNHKIGFHEKMDSGDFLTWLYANYKSEDNKNNMRFTKQEVAKNACVAKFKIVNLINRIYSEGLIKPNKKSLWEVTTDGFEIIKKNIPGGDADGAA